MRKAFLIIILSCLCCTSQQKEKINITEISKMSECDEKSGVLRFRIDSNEKNLTVKPEIYLSRKKPIVTERESVYIGPGILLLIFGPVISAVFDFKEQELPISNNDSVRISMGLIHANKDYEICLKEGDYYASIVNHTLNGEEKNNFMTALGYEHSYGRYPKAPVIEDFSNEPKDSRREVCKFRYAERSNRARIETSIINCSKLKIRRNDITVVNLDTSDPRENIKYLTLDGLKSSVKTRFYYGRLENPR